MAPEPAPRSHVWQRTAHLAPGEVWIQESIIGSRFAATYRRDGEQVLPSITGDAFITAEGMLVVDDRDPFRWGIRDAV